MNRTDYLREIFEHFSTIKNRLKSENGVGFYDINKSLERLFLPILNETFKLSLVHLEAFEKNYPAVDLMDVNQKIAVQVTTTSTITKIKDSVTKFTNHSLETLVDELSFLILNDKVNYRDLPRLKNGREPKVFFWEDLETHIANLKTTKIETILNHLKAELERPMIFLPGVLDQISLSDQHGSIDQYFSNQFFVGAMDRNFSEHLCHLYKEILSNNVKHGGGGRVTFGISKNKITIEIYGNKFDPRSLLNQTGGSGGKITITEFYGRYSYAFQDSYTFSTDNKGIYTLNFKRELSEVKIQDLCRITSYEDLREPANRSHCPVITYDLTQDPKLRMLNLSDAYILEQSVAKDLIASRPIVLLVGENDYRLKHLLSKEILSQVEIRKKK